MRYCNNFDEIAAGATNHERIWKSPHVQTLYTSRCRFRTDGSRRSEVIAEKRQGVMHSVQELRSQPKALTLVMCGGFLNFCCGLRKDANKGIKFSLDVVELVQWSLQQKGRSPRLGQSNLGDAESHAPTVRPRRRREVHRGWQSRLTPIRLVPSSGVERQVLLQNQGLVETQRYH
jgi:hypothetical protein